MQNNNKNDEHVIPRKLKKNEAHYADGKAVSSTLKNTSEVVIFDDLFDLCNGAALNRKYKGKPLSQAVTNSSEHEAFCTNSIRKLELV